MAKPLEILQKTLTVKQLLLTIVTIGVILYILSLFRGNTPLSINPASHCDTCKIGITDLVREVKSELLQLEDSMTHHNENEMFRLKTLEMEISFVVRQTASGKAGGNYEVLTVEGSRENSDEKVQKLILHWDAEESKLDTSKYVMKMALDKHFIDSIATLKKAKPSSILKFKK
jgi:hypothetical protein